jgi:hypothetical protein
LTTFLFRIKKARPSFERRAGIRCRAMARNDAESMLHGSLPPLPLVRDGIQQDYQHQEEGYLVVYTPMFTFWGSVPLIIVTLKNYLIIV